MKENIYEGIKKKKKEMKNYFYAAMERYTDPDIVTRATYATRRLRNLCQVPGSSYAICYGVDHSFSRITRDRMIRLD